MTKKLYFPMTIDAEMFHFADFYSGLIFNLNTFYQESE